MNKIKTAQRNGDRLFFDQYRYGLAFNLRNVSTLRGIDYTNIEKAHCIIDERFEYRNKLRNYGGNWGRPAAPPEVLESLHELVNILAPRAHQFRLVVSPDHGYIYSNDAEWLNELAQLEYLKNIEIREAVVNRPRDTVRVPGSAHTNRTYFKERWISTTTKDTLCNFLNNQENIRLGPSFKTWMTAAGSVHGEHLLCRHYFFDHDSESIPFMLTVAVPGLIRRTVQVLTK